MASFPLFNFHSCSNVINEKWFLTVKYIDKYLGQVIFVGEG